MKLLILDLFPTLKKNPLHRDPQFGVPQVFRVHTEVTENCQEKYELLMDADTNGCHAGVLI